MQGIFYPLVMYYDCTVNDMKSVIVVVANFVNRDSSYSVNQSMGG